MSFWERENLRAATGGVWLAQPERAITGLSTDTRTIKPGQAFLALTGEQHDGHTMVSEAGRVGCPLAIVENPAAIPGPVPPGMGILHVRDGTRRALCRLAAAYRRTLEGTKVIAVVGSNGKTTTVRLLASVLAQRLRGSASIKSFNNDIGVPLTILAAAPGGEYLICEVGTNSPGEIARLAEVAAPDIAVITSIGREHLERLGSLRGVAREEASVLEFVRRGGAGIYNSDAPHLAETIGTMPARPATLISFGFGRGADVQVAGARQTRRGIELTLNDRSAFRIGLLGRHNACNAAAAVVVGRRLGLTDAQIGAGLEAARGPEMRLERSEIGGVSVINDAYNANPDSMRAGLETLREVGDGEPRRVAVLGDMLELGGHADEEHRQIGVELAKRTDLDLIVLVGPSMRLAAEVLEGSARAGQTVWIEQMDERHAPRIAERLRPGDVVLLKGSRRMRLERLLGAVRERFSPASEPEPTRA
jgi:UDP-N-acetylmuramoyl-tripeptide--D-alanyl-D-alanine ligase